jgi:hypothetical protein
MGRVVGALPSRPSVSAATIGTPVPSTQMYSLAGLARAAAAGQAAGGGRGGLGFDHRSGHRLAAGFPAEPLTWCGQATRWPPARL